MTLPTRTNAGLVDEGPMRDIKKNSYFNTNHLLVPFWIGVSQTFRGCTGLLGLDAVHITYKQSTSNQDSHGLSAIVQFPSIRPNAIDSQLQNIQIHHVPSCNTAGDALAVRNAQKLHLDNASVSTSMGAKRDQKLTYTQAGQMSKH